MEALTIYSSIMIIAFLVFTLGVILDHDLKPGYRAKPGPKPKPPTTGSSVIKIK